MQENADQNNPERGQFSRSAGYLDLIHVHGNHDFWRICKFHLPIFKYSSDGLTTICVFQEVLYMRRYKLNKPNSMRFHE